jgi:hypothetical protein
MLGNGARFIGPSASAAGSTNDLNAQHQAQFSRGIWPTTFQTNGSECKLKTHEIFSRVFQDHWRAIVTT